MDWCNLLAVVWDWRLVDTDLFVDFLCKPYFNYICITEFFLASVMIEQEPESVKNVSRICDENLPCKATRQLLVLKVFMSSGTLVR